MKFIKYPNQLYYAQWIRVTSLCNNRRSYKNWFILFRYSTVGIPAVWATFHNDIQILVSKMTFSSRIAATKRASLADRENQLNLLHQQM